MTKYCPEKVFFNDGQGNRNFLQLPQKNFIRPLSLNKERFKSQFTILDFASEGILHAIWAIIYFSGHEP